MTSEEIAYKKINLILAGVLLTLFIYSGIFSAEKGNHPIQSAHKQLTGEESLSSGLSRSFSSIIRLDFKTARQYNPYGISLFIYFACQLVFRFVAIFISKKKLLKFKRIVIIDITISGLLFILHFEPFISDLVHR